MFQTMCHLRPLSKYLVVVLIKSDNFTTLNVDRRKIMVAYINSSFAAFRILKIKN